MRPARLQAQAGRLDGRPSYLDAGLALPLGEFDNQDGVFARQADQHHKANLCTNADIQAGQVNDWNGHVPLPTATSNMTTVVKALRSVGCDVILMSGVPSKATYFPSYDAQYSYVTNMQRLAHTLDVPFIDIWTLFGASWNAGAMFDSLHPNRAGYELIAGYAKKAALNPSARSAS